MKTELSTVDRRVASATGFPTKRLGKGVLVIGDQRVLSAAQASARIGRHVVAWTDSADSPVVGRSQWDSLVVDARLLVRLQDDHPNLLDRARQVWLVPESAGSAPPHDPFGHPLPAAGRVVKRATDIVLSLLGLLLALPLLLLAMVAVRIDSPGPMLFEQVRVGADGRRFRLRKVRTMLHGRDDARHQEYVAQLIRGTAQQVGGMFKLLDDPRITRVGRFLRHFSIDELPQLWNVLMGDMSLVGPRPPLPKETGLYDEKAWQRMRVKPGLTGLWQVSGRCQLSFDEMVALDVRYWQRWSLRQDLMILVKTPYAVVAGVGAG